MAKGTVTTEYVEKEVTKVVEVAVNTIVLELTQEEADVLYAISMAVGGMPDRLGKKQPRGHMDAIRGAVVQAGGGDNYVETTGSISLPDYK